MKISRKLLLLCGIVVAMSSCKDDIDSTFQDYTEEEYALLSQRLDLPIGAYSYSANFEEHFFDNSRPGHNPHVKRADHKATLGRVLFYDNNLSINETVSCASCHKQELAFSDDVALSEGFDGQITTRNSLPLGNTIGFETSYSGGGGNERAFFSWDEANQDISSQSEAAITSTIEMGLDMPNLVTRLRGQEHYKILFRKAFGDSEIRDHRILESIEEFVNSIVSKESEFDHALMENGNTFRDFDSYSDAQNRGKSIFNTNCATCHSDQHQFTAVATANNGLDMTYEDKGVGAHTGQSWQNGVFKVPFLRNVELTAPYMHDGRFATLDDVLEHYSSGIQNHQNLDERLKSNNGAVRMNFTNEQKSDLKAYLMTLTDQKMIADVKFSDPFKS